MAFTENGVTITEYFAKRSEYAQYLRLGGGQSVGNNSYGQLGLLFNVNISNRIAVSSPVVLTASYNWNDISLLRSGKGTAFVDAEDKLNTVGNLQSFSNEPTLLRAGQQWKEISKTTYYDNINIFAIDSVGALWAWGNNSYGQLGFGDKNSRLTPVQVGSLSDWSQISDSLTENFTVAKKTDGTLWAWGNNSYGQLGVLNLSQTSSPAVVGFSVNTWREVDSRGEHNIAIRQDGTLWSWGLNNYGQLGLSDLTNRSSPTQIGTSSDWSKVWAGPYQSYANKTDGTTWVWGFSSSFSALGLSDLTDRYSPVQMGVSGEWSEFSIRQSINLAIKTDGTLWSWGSNAFGQLGLSDNTTRYSPVQVGTLSDWSKVGTMLASGFAIKTDGTLWSWGRNNTGGLGLSDLTNRSSPVQVGVDTDWDSLAADSLSCLVTKTDGTLWSWGSNAFGQLGVSDLTTRYSPTQVGSDTNWSQVDNHALAITAIKTDGTLWAWGYNGTGQLGLSDNTNRYSPTQVGSDTNWSQVSGGTYHTIAIKTDGTAWLAGYNINGVLGTLDNIDRGLLTRLGLGVESNWSQVTTGLYHVAAVKSDGTLWTWGNNSYGQLGVSDQTDRSSPVQVGVDNNWSKVISGPNHNLATKTDGTLWSWGLNSHGQLGLLDQSDRYSPVQVGVDTDWNNSEISSVRHTLAVKSNGTLWAWGSNASGQLGLSNLTSRYSPTQVGTLSTWTKAKTGYTNSFFVNTDGTLWACGNNQNGQSGWMDTTSRYSPILIGSESNWTNVFPQYSTTYLLNSSNQIWAFGSSISDTTEPYLGFGYIFDSNYPLYYVEKQSNIPIKNMRTSATGVYGIDKNDNTIVQYSLNDLPSIDTSFEWTSFDTGYYHFVGIKSDGTAWSLGHNLYGQLGLSDQTYRSSLVQIGSRSDWSKVYCSDYGSMLIDNSMSAWAFGKNDGGQLGTSQYLTNHYSPVQIAITQTLSLSMDDNNIWIIDNNRNLWKSGKQNYPLVTWNGGIIYSPILAGTSQWTKISASNPPNLGGANFYKWGAGIKTDGTLWTWGDPYYSQLGVSTTVNFITSPTALVYGNKFTKISTAPKHGAALGSDGVVWIWGGNTYGQLGLSDNTNRRTPVQLPGSDWSDVVTGPDRTFLIKQNGSLWVTGAQGAALGTSNTLSYSSPVQVSSVTGWNQVVTGNDSTVAIRNNGEMWAWGGFYVGYSRNSPAQLGSTSDWSKVSCGYHHALAIKTDGTLWSWGWNQSGCLGQSDTTTRITPMQVGSLSDWSKVSAGRYHSLAIKTDGTLWSWGLNAYGQLGLSDNIDRYSPVQVGTLSDWSVISAGNDFSLSIKSNGSLWGFGYDSPGNIPRYQGSPFFEKKSTTGDTWNTVSTSLDNTYFTKLDGSAWCVGNNSYGVLGQSNLTQYSSPVRIGTLNITRRLVDNVVKVTTRNNSAIILQK